MVNLVLYSDQTAGEGAEIDACLLGLLRERRGGARIGYVASGPDPEHTFFQAGRAYYARLGLDLCLYHDLDLTRDAMDIARLFACDAIHLSGGHTGDFLMRLKRSALLAPLRDWARGGGVLIGVSAGAILMAPTIATDALFLGERPEDVEGEALDLMPLEFFPHLDDDAAYLPALLRYSRHTRRPILACNDGDGAVVHEGRVACFGKAIWIVDGAVTEARGTVSLEEIAARSA